MIFDFKEVESFYSRFNQKVNEARTLVGRPLTLAEKILYAHLFNGTPAEPLVRHKDYAGFRPDRVAMQDATAQMAVLQFMNAGKDSVAVPSTVHCDHLICACDGAEPDLATAIKTNAEVYDFLRQASARYGIGFWKPGAGIIHQIVLENYAFPGGMMVGTDSHTPNAGGLGMLAIGVGGADAVDVMAGMEWELKVPKIIGVRLTGKLSGWASPKDVILKLAGILTVKGGTNAIIEYSGEGASSLSCTGKATICNMGAEVGATCSVFPYDAKMAEYLMATGREAVAKLADACKADLAADPEVALNPEEYYDQIIDIDLSTLEPHVNGPFTPDAACPISKMKERVKEMDYPQNVEVALIGSCTNSSYQDLARAASVAEQALSAGLSPKASLIVSPGSEQIRLTAERDGILPTLRKAGATVMTNACGPCIGQWKRKTDDPTRRNAIVTSFNRNFAKRADGNPNTHAFIVSPEIAVATAFGSLLGFDPSSDSIGSFRFAVPSGDELPASGFVPSTDGFIAPAAGSPAPVIKAGSERLQILSPFPAWDGKDFSGLHLLIKTKGKCTTDHISMAGPWLRFRGHLQNISENMLMGAVNAFNGKTSAVRNLISGEEISVAASARIYKEQACGSIVVAEDNYGEGSSREHAAMEPRYLGVKAILAKSFARIHETNLKKQGVLALTFACPEDYGKVMEDDIIEVRCAGITPGADIEVVLTHSDGTIDTIMAHHTYNKQQIKWFKAGSALNSLKAEQ
ncbi:MAG: aconitate hydratase [Bacteroidales bacterium]|nr:aconitate hydratase [Bacteroidales bacterium]